MVTRMNGKLGINKNVTTDRKEDAKKGFSI